MKSPIYSAEALSELGLEQRKLEKALQVIKKENQTFDDQVELSKQRPLFYKIRDYRPQLPQGSFDDNLYSFLREAQEHKLCEFMKINHAFHHFKRESLLEILTKQDKFKFESIKFLTKDHPDFFDILA